MVDVFGVFLAKQRPHCDFLAFLRRSMEFFGSYGETKKVTALNSVELALVLLQAASLTRTPKSSAHLGIFHCSFLLHLGAYVAMDGETQFPEAWTSHPQSMAQNMAMPQSLPISTQW